MSEHTCRVCEGGNQWKPGTLGYDARELQLTGHALFNYVADALRIPQMVCWLNRVLTRG